MPTFTREDLQLLTLPSPTASKSQNGQLTIIAGSDLIHGAALLALQISTRITDMVFLASPFDRFNSISQYIKSRISSFIWIPLEEVDSYIAKSDAILIGPGLKRFHSENNIPQEGSVLDYEGRYTKELTEKLLDKFPQKQWIIDAGSLQTISASHLPPGSIITPNKKEFQLLFGFPSPTISNPQSKEEINQAISILQNTAKQHSCHIVSKGNPTIIASPHSATCIHIPQPAALTKGATGDCLAALIAALACKNPPHLAAASADFLLKHTALNLQKKVGPFFNADDLAKELPNTMHEYIK